MANAATALAEPRHDQVEGLLSYLVNTGVRPTSYNYDPPPGVPVRSSTASSSASESAPAPLSSSLSRGRSHSGQSRIAMQQA